MKILIDWIPDNLLQALGWTLVHSLWQLVLISGLLWLVLKLAHRRSAAVKYGMAVGALLLSLAMSVGTFVYEYEPMSEAVAMDSRGDLSKWLENTAFAEAEVSVESGIFSTASWIEQNIPLVVNLWILGALLFLFRLLNSLSEIRGLRRSASPVTDFQLQKVFYRLVGKMDIKREVQFQVSSFGLSPLTFGTFKPVILFPVGLVFQLSPAQLEAIIAHELAHVKRNDYLANLLLSGLEVLFFFHPCYWWMNSTVKELRENAADDLVLKAGIEPKVLANALAEVLNFAKQNPPELALAAGKRRNPTLQRIKRILGYPSQNYPQTPIISIPMLVTLFLSVGLIASAQQDAPQQTGPMASVSPVAVIQPTFTDTVVQQDTVVRKAQAPVAVKAPKGDIVYERNVMVFTGEDGKDYQIKGDLLISDGDTVPLSPKVKAELDKLRAFDSEKMPRLDMTVAPVFPADMVPMPALDMSSMPTMSMMPPVPAFEMSPMPAMPPMPAMDFDFSFDQVMPPFPFSFADTTKMSKQDREKWAKEMELKAEEWEKHAAEWEAKFEKEFEPKMKEFELKMKQWEDENSPRMKEYQAKMKDWEAANEPKFKEFEAKMKEWEALNGPKMKEFEAKMEAWQKAHEPKMKDFELRMKEWETVNQPKMEEFQRKMEIWQKEHQDKMQEFQKLLQEELKKGN